MNNFEGGLGPHHLFADFSDDFLSECTPRVEVGLPYPIHKPLVDCENDEIKKYREDFVRYKKEFSTVAGDIRSRRYQSKPAWSNSHAITRKGILDLYQETVKRQKMPYESEYNPYFATGILGSFYFNNNTYLITADIKNNIRVTNLCQYWHNQKLNLKRKISDPILGLSLSQSTDEICLLLRHSTRLELLKFRENTEFVVSTWSKYLPNIILDAHFHGPSKQVGYIDDTFNLVLINAARARGKTVKYDLATKFGIQNAFKFEFVDESKLSILGRNSFSILDVRTSRDHLMYKPKTIDCNKFSSFKMDDKFVYVGSTHYLTRADLRMLKEPDYCTHLMKSAPCYMDLTKDCLCLGSQNGDKAIFVGNPINSLPIKVPTMTDSLVRYRLEKDLFKEIPQLQKRISMSTSGIKLMEENGEFNLCSSNYVGDLFKQKIYFNDEVTEDSEASDNFLKWTTELPEPPAVLHLNDVVNMFNARLSLNKQIDPEKLSKFDKNSKKADMFLNNYGKIFCRKNYGQLAANFATIWDDDGEIDAEENIQLAPEVQALDKVHSWIESNSFID